ncbi:sigma-70 family RNA polymerase sigma factor [Parapedobacter sp. ISTM3]|uniref:sigma-70 family RNA polymerase sigma factor n=1 Tax=Parapedobacter TaxID=416949 RepID=UPI001115CB1B|nr:MULTISPECIES: sigma-70 family RNA polymerase sigma factor [Parapedobacter]MBK1441943.1 sigma-70 family RNA polymerase sigma factor [Parapedobacter sp. ISTM3]
MNKPNIETDAELLERISKDDQVAFKALYKRYWKKCYMLVLRRSGDTTLAEDLTQSIFVSLWEKRRSSMVRNVGAYLAAAVRFQFISYLKSQFHEDTYVHHLQREQSDLQNPVEVSMRIKELNEAIDKGVAMMPPKTKTVYTLSRTEHYSVKEIARKLNLSEKAVEYHITQSLKMMRLALKDFLPIALFFREIF